MAAAMSITATLVVPVSTAGAEEIVTWGEAVTAGQIVYLKSDGLYWKAQADGMLPEATVKGVALSGGSANQRGVIAKGGTVTIGGTVVAGTPYYLHTTAGGIGLHSDLASTNYAHYLGQGTSTTVINFDFRNTGVVV